MNVSIQLSAPNGVVKPSINFTFAALLAGLLLLLFSAPVARAHQQPVNCSGSGLGILLFTDSADVHVGDTLTYGVTVFNGTGLGPVVCDAEGITAFIVTPDGVTNKVTLSRTNLSNGQGDYYPNAATYVVRQQDILPDGTVRATARDVGIIHQNDTDSTGGGFQGVNTEVSQPCIAITVQCVGGVGENGLITFTGTVTNCGNNTLVGVTVTNFVNGGQFSVAFITNLLKGQIASFSGSYVPANPCLPSTATFTAQGVDQFTARPRTVTSSANTTCGVVVTPGIRVTKVCPIEPVIPGQLLTFSGSVSNTGNVTLNNIVVVNNQPVANSIVFNLASLAPGETVNFTGSYLAPTNCSVADTLTARAASICGVQVTNSATATCPILTTPQITVTAFCPVGPIVPGGTVTYTGTVLNNGNITLTNVVVFSDRPAANTTLFTVNTLAPGASTNFTATYTVPTNACSVATTFRGQGRDICTLNSVTNSTTTICTVTTAPSIGVTLNCPLVTVAVGGLITYTGTVTNSGNVILNNVTVINSQAGTVLIVPSMAAHSSSNFTASFTVPADACSVSSTVNVSGNDNCTQATVNNSASATCSVTTAPLLTIIQNCPISPVIPGGLFTYSGTVSNAGNVTITNVVVLNNVTGSTQLLTNVTLLPGMSTNFTGSYLASAACSSTSTSTATGRSTCGVAVSIAVTSTCAISTTPLLTITQNCPVSPVAPGGLLIYSGTVSNAGNITLTNVTVLNNVSGGTPLLSNFTLAPGATANFTGNYTAPTNCSSVSTSTATGRSICGVAVTSSVTTDCPVTTTPLITITQNCPVSPVAPGGLLIYSGSVSNAGNITLTNITVLNNVSGITPLLVNVMLLPHTSTNFTGNYIAPTNCSSTSTSTVTAQSICGVSVTNATTVTCAVTTTPLLTITQNCPVGSVIPGGLFVYSGTVSNAGNITITNVVVLNNVTGGTPLLSNVTLLPHTSTNFTGSYTAPAACLSSSTSTVTGLSVCGITATSSVTSTCAITTTPLLTITQNCPVSPVVPGGLFTYSGTVSNAGNITITNVIVLNNVSGGVPVLAATTLAPGATVNFSGSYTAPTNCSSTSTSTAFGTSICGVAVNTSVTSTCAITTTPLLLIAQNCPVSPVIPGGLFTYSGTVTNAGNITITNIIVLNNVSGGTPLFTNVTLAPHTSTNFSGSYLAPTNCTSTSISTATGTSICGVSVTNSVTSVCAVTTTPLLTITQDCPVNPVFAGGLFTYSGTVSNAGNILITNIIVLNNVTGGTPLLSNVTLSPGATTNFTGSYIAPTGCATTSTSTVTGRSICGVAVSSSATRTCTIITTPAIVVTQNCPNNSVLPGGILTYSGTVSNAGNITLTNIIVVNNRPASNTVIFTVATLVPGATANFTGSYVVPLDCCLVWSTVKASGQGCDGVTVTDTFTRTCTVLTLPKIVVTKVCTPGILRPGDLLTYSGIVSNAGNITLLNVTVSNNQPANSPPVYGPAILAPGEWAAYTVSFIVPPDFCGSDTVTARGNDVCTFSQVTNGVTSTCPITTAPRITVTKNCPLFPTPRGGLYTFTGSVSNAGNVTLYNVFVTDNQPSNNTPVIGPITLVPGVSVNFTNSYIAPTCCCLVFDTVTARGQDLCSGSNVTATATSVCPLLSTPQITVTKVCPQTTVPVGGLFTYNGLVSNTGDVTLTNVYVKSSQPNANTILLGPIELAPHESKAYSGSYIVTTNSDPITEVVTATGTDSCQGRTVTAGANCFGPIGELRIISITLSNSIATVTWTATPGTTYTLQYKLNLMDPNWSDVPGNVTAVGNTASKNDAVGSAQQRFYRVIVAP